MRPAGFTNVVAHRKENNKDRKKSTDALHRRRAPPSPQRVAAANRATHRAQRASRLVHKGLTAPLLPLLPFVFPGSLFRNPRRPCATPASPMARPAAVARLKNRATQNEGKL